MALTNFVKNIRNIMRNDAGINGDAQRIEQIAWMLFLKVYDEKENDWEFNEDNYQSFIPKECRWRNWAKDDGTGEALTADKLLSFVNNTLFPTLKSLEVTPDTPMRSAIVRTTFQDANQYMKDGVLLRQVLNVIDGLDLSNYEESHTFGEIYEAILKEMQSAGSAGEFYTPRALTDFMAQIIQPKVGERMADFACGTGGFLTSWLKALDKQVTTVEEREAYSQSIYGIEKKQFPYMLCVTNMLLHDIDSPKVFHDNSLTKDVLNYTDRDKFDVILMNPPYGGNEKNDVKRHFPSDLASSETADLFMVVIMYRLAKQGRAAVILPDGFLFGADNAKLAIKEKLLREFNLHTVIRLPGSIFSPYTSISTNILFFNNERAKGAAEGFSTKETWFYRFDMPEGYKHFSKTKPMLLDHCKPIMDWWGNRKEIVDSETGDEKSRRFTAQELLNFGGNFDQCKFPKEEEEVLRPKELLEQFHEIRTALNNEVDKIVTNVETILSNKDGEAINPRIENPCGKLANLISSFPEKLKKSLLQEAIQGRLVPQDPNDEPASVLLNRIRKEKARLVKDGKLKKKDLIETPISEDEIPFEIPDNWMWVKFGTMVNTIMGKTPERGNAEYWSNASIPWVSISDMKQGETIFNTKESISKKAVSSCFANQISPKGSLLMSFKLTVGRTSILGIDACHNEAIITIKTICDKDFYTRNYLFYILPIITTWGDSKDAIKGKTLNSKSIFNLAIPLPPLSEQHRIVVRLEQLLSMINKL